STWLIRITLNQSLMKLRKRRPTREVSIDNNFQSEEDNRPLDVADWAPNPEELYSAAELREILRKTLQELGPGLSLSAVKARSWRARLQLRERLSEYFNMPEDFAGVEPCSNHAELADLGAL